VTAPTSESGGTDHRWLWWLPFLLASAVFAGWASFTSQRLLGELIGWNTPWLMPAILDNLAAGTVLAYILIKRGFTAVVSGVVLLVSALANAQAHFYDPNTADLLAPMWVAIAWSVLPPVAVFTIAHFMVEARKEPDAPGLQPTAELDADTDRARSVPADRGGDADAGESARQVVRPRKRATARASSGRGSRAGRPNGPTVDELVAIIHAEGLTSQRQVLAHGVGLAKAKEAMARAGNGHTP
jgi:hypothetical protein